MSESRALVLLLNAFAGVILGACLIGLMLVGLATAIYLRAEEAVALTSHPLFAAGIRLLTTSLLTGTPLLAFWYFRKKT